MKYEYITVSISPSPGLLRLKELVDSLNEGYEYYKDYGSQVILRRERVEEN